MQFQHYLHTRLELQLTSPADREVFQAAWSRWEAKCAALWFPHELSATLALHTHTLREWIAYYFTGIALVADGKVMKVTTAWRQPRDVSRDLSDVPLRPRLHEATRIDTKKADGFVTNLALRDTPFDLGELKFPPNQDNKPKPPATIALIRNMAALYALMRFGTQYLPTHAMLYENPALLRNIYRDVAAGKREAMAPFLHPRVLSALLYEEDQNNIDDAAIDHLSQVVAQLPPALGAAPPQTLGAALMRALASKYADSNLDIALASVGLPAFLNTLILPFAERAPRTSQDLLMFEVMSGPGKLG